MRKLIILPGTGGIGGTTVTLAALIDGFEQCGVLQALCILVKDGSLLEQYLRQGGQSACLQPIQAENRVQFHQNAIDWIAKQPASWPLLMDSCTSQQLLQSTILATPILRRGGRSIYHFFHDPGYSEHWIGSIARKLMFSYLRPEAICNSQFTADKVCPRLVPKIKGILYQPVNLEKFKPASNSAVPDRLRPILNTGAKIMLTPSRISQPEQFNDKNLRGLIPVLAHLKATGHHYHGVVIGRDTSENQEYTYALLEQAKSLNLADRFTILPPTFSIEDYYAYADIVVTLAPREPFGRIVVEAIACGVPVVGSNTGGINEILQHFAPQWTVDPFNIPAVAETIVQVMADADTSETLAKGRCWVEQHCHPQLYANRIREITGLSSSISLKSEKNQYREAIS